MQGDVLDEPRSRRRSMASTSPTTSCTPWGGGGDGGFAERDRAGAERFARAAAPRASGGSSTSAAWRAAATSEHLRSREEVAEILARAVPDTVHARAAMVIGAGSASFLILRHLVDRLPAMVCPRWIDTRTQPIAIRDVSAHWRRSPTRRQTSPDEVQLGGADVLSYREMMRRYAAVAGRRSPLVVRVPVLTPRLSSYWLGL